MEWQQTYNNTIENKNTEHIFLKIVGINFIIFLSYFIVILILPFTLFLIFLYPLQVIVNFIIGVIYAIKKNYRYSVAYFITAMLISIVGFGSCFFVLISGIVGL